MRSVLTGWLLKSAVALALCVWLLGRLDAPGLVRAVGDMSFLHLASALLLLVPNLAFQAIKWGLLVRAQLPRATGGRIVLSFLAGTALGTLTPGRLGEHARAACFGGRRTELAALSLLDKFSSAAVTSLFGALGLLLLPRWDLSIFGRAAPLVLLLLGLYAAAVLVWTLAGLALLLAPARVTGLLGRLPWLAARERFARVHGAMLLVRRPRRLGLLAAALAFYLTFITQFVLLARGLGLDSTLAPAAAAGTMFLKSLFPISLGDLGVRELFAANLFASIGGAPELAVTAAFLLFVINVLLPSLAGSWAALALRPWGGREDR
ncbi:MAG: lysylphosphatidylglycerol synthase domain-containing protein [bacterium]|jgi:hypothetical protein|nr:lysylphosphatidylglycerol synthase domain-containing protein [bacterium]